MHFQNSTIIQTEKEISVNFPHSKSMLNNVIFSPFSPTFHKPDYCIDIFNKINKLTRRSEGVKENEIIFHFSTNKKIKQKQIRLVMRSIWKTQRDQLLIYPSLTRKTDPTPTPDCVAFFFFSLAGDVEKLSHLHLRLLLSPQPRFPSIAGPREKILKQII